jgi:uncharacterized protein (DUF1800 family)
MDMQLRALNRFGTGARPGERARIGDPRDWLRRQLEGGAPRQVAPAVATPDALGAILRGLRRPDAAEREEWRRRAREVMAVETAAAIGARVTSDRPYVERLVAFWSNHLCISVGARAAVGPLAGSYERDVIRAHVLGRFEDMVLASARHPAMLIYLDNAQSIGPDSRAGRALRRGGARRGLNENYARELLELHTLGVDGGYEQADVQELARILTGWTVAGAGGPGAAGGMQGGAAAGPVRFAFEPRLHEPGAKTVLGVRYAEAGAAEGERVIRALCRHPATARFIATKLVRHFVADDPPAAAIDRIARVFTESGGDLRVTAAALVETPDAWAPDFRKFRTPQDWLVAVLRAFGAEAAAPSVAPLLRQLRQPLWSPQSPKGFGDTAVEWSDPDALMNRAELARSLARRLAGGRLNAERARQAARVGVRPSSPDPSILRDVMDVEAGDPVHAMLEDSTISPADRTALAVAGPAFQWR